MNQVEDALKRLNLLWQIGMTRRILKLWVDGVEVTDLMEKQKLTGGLIPLKEK